jgi:hypothetical protein
MKSINYFESFSSTLSACCGKIKPSMAINKRNFFEPFKVGESVVLNGAVEDESFFSKGVVANSLYNGEKSFIWSFLKLKKFQF